MTKEELKNRVLNGGRGSGQSLRVLIEVYENKIVDLEQKNKDLADCNARLLTQVAAATKRVVALEKENTELKEKLEHRNCLDCSNHDSNIKLTKATKLLNEFMRISKASDEDFEHDYSELIGETEQFISEVEK